MTVCLLHTLLITYIKVLQLQELAFTKNLGCTRKSLSQLIQIRPLHESAAICYSIRCSIPGELSRGRQQWNIITQPIALPD